MSREARPAARQDQVDNAREQAIVGVIELGIDQVDQLADRRHDRVTQRRLGLDELLLGQVPCAGCHCQTSLQSRHALAVTPL